jgi:hypothetical protein
VSTTAPTVEKVTRTRVIPPAELEQEQRGRTTPDFWEFIESMTDEMWAGDFMLYIMREDPKPSMYGGANTLEKCPGYMMMPNGVRVKLDSREDVELAIKEKWGGKAFRLILKKGRERLTEGKCMNDAPPKYPDTAAAQYHQNPLPGAATDASVASKAIDVMANQQPDAMRLAMEVLRSASEIVMRTAQPAATPAVPPRDPLVEALLQRALNPPPPPDPFDMFVKFKNLMGDGGGMGGASAMMEKVLGAAVDKIINPAPAITGRTTLLDIGREFIPVLGTVMHEYRLSREADARITEIQRSAMPQQPMQTVPQPNPPAAVTQLPAVAQPAAPPPPATPALTFEQIEAHIAKIVSNTEYSTDEAVDKVLEFLYDTDPRIVGALLNPQSLDKRLKPGKDGLMQLFSFEPTLKPCLANVPRLSEFLDKFIVAATEAEAAEARLRAAAPVSTTPA